MSLKSVLLNLKSENCEDKCFGFIKMNKILNISAVIELNSSEFTDKDYECPNGTWYEYPEGWNNHWKKCLKDSGLIKVEQIIAGISMVNIETIEENELDIIVQNQLKDTNLDNDEEILSFEGGIAIQFGEVNIVPQCCSSIGDCENWNKVIFDETIDWKSIWIGHPWIFVRKREDKIEFSEYCEQNKYNGEPILVADFNEFKAKFERTIETISVFRERIERILRKNRLKRASQISEILIGKL